MSDDKDGEFPETGAGVGENDAVATGPETEDDASENTVAEDRYHTCCQGTRHDSIKSVIQLYAVPDEGT